MKQVQECECGAVDSIFADEYQGRYTCIECGLVDESHMLEKQDVVKIQLGVVDVRTNRDDMSIIGLTPTTVAQDTGMYRRIQNRAPPTHRVWTGPSRQKVLRRVTIIRQRLGLSYDQGVDEGAMEVYDMLQTTRNEVAKHVRVRTLAAVCIAIVIGQTAIRMRWELVNACSIVESTLTRIVNSVVRNEDFLSAYNTGKEWKWAPAEKFVPRFVCMMDVQYMRDDIYRLTEYVRKSGYFSYPPSTIAAGVLAYRLYDTKMKHGGRSVEFISSRLGIDKARIMSIMGSLQKKKLSVK